jgi:hypothetical protein
MKSVRSSVWGLVLFALCIPAIPLTFAQTNPSPATGLVTHHGAAGTEYLNGGAGEEERAAMAARQSEFPFKVVLSAAGGEFVVAEKLSVSTPQGELLEIRDAGPIVMIKLPPGQYTLVATWQGKTERRSVRLAGPAQSLVWRFSG